MFIAWLHVCLYNYGEKLNGLNPLQFVSITSEWRWELPWYLWYPMIRNNYPFVLSPSDMLGNYPSVLSPSDMLGIYEREWVRRFSLVSHYFSTCLPTTLNICWLCNMGWKLLLFTSWLQTWVTFRNFPNGMYKFPILWESLCPLISILLR